MGTIIRGLCPKALTSTSNINIVFNYNVRTSDRFLQTVDSHIFPLFQVRPIHQVHIIVHYVNKGYIFEKKKKKKKKKTSSEVCLMFRDCA